ncbi:MAG: hypothetical protein ISR77_27135 [Pirellulaceae bacterium]|nr:hypothetical protein [Pirellulaceae bacterium]
MVNHLYRGSASGPHTRSKKLNQWARSQDVPVIAVGDYNFDCDYPKGIGRRSKRRSDTDSHQQWPRQSRVPPS